VGEIGKSPAVRSVMSGSDGGGWSCKSDSLDETQLY